VMRGFDLVAALWLVPARCGPVSLAALVSLKNTDLEFGNYINASSPLRPVTVMFP